MKIMIICIFLLTGVSTQATSLSLQEAIKIALKENKELQSSQKNVEQARYDYRSSLGKYLPQISLEGKYSTLDKPLEIDLTSMRTAMIGSGSAAAQVATQVSTGGNTTAAQTAASTTQTQLNSALPPFVLEVQKKSYTNAALVAVQPLFMGGKIIANMRAKDAGFSAAQEQNRATRDKIICDVVTRYFAVQLMDKILEIKKELVESLTEHQKHAEQLLKQGLLSKANKMRADVALAEAQRELSKSQREKELALILLNNTLGEVQLDPSLTSPLFLTTHFKDLNEYTKLALENNANLKTLEYKNNQLEQKYRSNVGNFLPQIAAFSRYELHKSDLTSLEPAWVVGVSLKMNIFNGGTDYNELQAANEERTSLELYTANVKDLVLTEVKKQYHELNTAKEQNESLKTSLALAEENLRLNKVSFNSGIATSLEVIDAQLALEKVKVEQSKAIFDFDIALVNLLRASGDASRISEFN